MVSALLGEMLFLLGNVAVFGYLSALVLKKIGVPNVVAYVISGFILANFLLPQRIYNELDSWFPVVENLALGLIGYHIGNELDLRLLLEEGKKILLLLIGEASGKFLGVFILVFIVAQDFLAALLLGALATATAPAATVEVIKRCRAQGELTQNIQWLLAFDDIIAVLFVESIISYVRLSFGHKVSLPNYLLEIVREIGLAIILGAILGYLLPLLLRMAHSALEDVEVRLAVVVFGIGAAAFIQTSVITTSMTIGIVVGNRSKSIADEFSTQLLESIMSPAIMLFFLLVGSTLRTSDLWPFPIISIAYLLGRTGGVVLGTFVGATIAGEKGPIRNYLGFSLLAQGGVALGLLSITNDVLREGGENETTILLSTAILISTVFSEILGSYGTKYALTKAGEIGAKERSVYETPKGTVKLVIDEEGILLDSNAFESEEKNKVSKHMDKFREYKT